MLGILGMASGGVSQAIGTAWPGNIFNIAGVQLNQDLLPNLINIGISILEGRKK